MSDDSDAPTLLPCPFCGGKAEIVTRDVEPQGDPWYGPRNERFPECSECSAVVFDGYWHDGFGRSEGNARLVAAWNRRALPPDMAAYIRTRARAGDPEAAALWAAVAPGIEP